MCALQVTTKKQLHWAVTWNKPENFQ